MNTLDSKVSTGSAHPSTSKVPFDPVGSPTGSAIPGFGGGKPASSTLASSTTTDKGSGNGKAAPQGFSSGLKPGKI